MNSIIIKESIANWEAIRQDNAQLLQYLDQGSFFNFNRQVYPKVSPSIHAYPGIYEGKLYFFLIPSEYDKEEYSDEIDKYVTVCDVTDITAIIDESQILTVTGQNRITETEAKKRINAWKKNYKSWIPKQVASAIGIFKAFSIPCDDFVFNTAQINFALKVSSELPGGFEADLIIISNNGKETFYDDFVTPVPPFSPSLAPESFYLLP